MGKKIQTANEVDIPEVMNFIQAQERIEEFKQMHAEVFTMYDQLADFYNTSLEAAEKICRATQVSCGPFVLKHFATKYDGKKLFEQVGRDKFLELGGTLGSEPTYEIDKARFEAAVAARKVSKEIVEQVRKETPNFTKPDKLVLP
jgi:hypothetical protein